MSLALFAMAAISQLICPYITSDSNGLFVIAPKAESYKHSGPFDRGKRLFEAAPEPKSFYEISGGHNERTYLDDPGYIKAVENLLKQESASRN